MGVNFNLAPCMDINNNPENPVMSLTTSPGKPSLSFSTPVMILRDMVQGTLKAVGVNFNLAPCMDINNNPENPVIGVRSYGDPCRPPGRW